MSLKARLRGLEAKVEWLERWGELRKVEQALKYRESMKRIVDHLTANPTAAARLGVADLTRVRPGHPARPPLSDVIARARARVAQAATQDGATQAGAAMPGAPRHPPPPPPEPPPPPAPPPETEAWTHDPPEHLQIEKVTWRRRGPADDLDDEDEDDDDDVYDAFKDG